MKQQQSVRTKVEMQADLRIPPDAVEEGDLNHRQACFGMIAFMEFEIILRMDVPARRTQSEESELPCELAQRWVVRFVGELSDEIEIPAVD